MLKPRNKAFKEDTKFRVVKGITRDEYFNPVEGFWKKKEKSNSPLPWPKANSKPWPGQKQFLKAFKKAPFRIAARYKGFAACRLCGKGLGSCDTVLNVKGKTKSFHWTVPEGYLHYVTAHNVKPSAAFIKRILTYLPKKSGV